MANKDMVIQSNSPIEFKVNALIYCISREIESDTAKTLKKYGLSKAQLDILDELDNTKLPSLTVNQIKSIMLDENPNVSRSLNRLMENEFIVKNRNLDDQRVVRISITEKGRRIHKEADTAILNTTKKINLSDDELETLYSLLAKI